MIKKRRSLFVMVCATERLKTGSSRNKTYHRVWESGRPNRKSRFSQRDGTLNHWDRCSGTTNQDDPIGNQDLRKKTEHRMTTTDLPGQQIRMIESEIKILAKRQNIAWLGQIIRGDELGWPKNRQILNRVVIATCRSIWDPQEYHRHIEKNKKNPQV